MIISSQKHDLYSGDNVATKTMQFSDWVTTRADSVAYQFAVATLTASYVDIRVEGRYNSDARSASVYAKRYTSVTTVDDLVNVVIDLPESRVGVVASPASGPNNVYVSLVLVDVK